MKKRYCHCMSVLLIWSTAVMRAMEDIEAVIARGDLLTIQKCESVVDWNFPVDESGVYPIHIAVKERQVPILCWLLNTKRVSVEARDALGRTPLFMLAIYRDCRGFEHDSDIASLLLNNGANINALCCSGKTALSYAASAHNNQLVAWFIHHNADIWRRGYDGELPIVAALKSVKVGEHNDRCEKTLVHLLEKGGESLYNMICCIGRLDMSFDMQTILEVAWRSAVQMSRHSSMLSGCC